MNMTKIQINLSKIVIVTMVASLVFAVVPVRAASLTSMSDTMTRQAPTTDSNHTILFTTPTGVVAGETITITFDSNFDTSLIDEDDVDIADDGTDLTTAADCTAAEEASVAVATDIVTITICTGDGGDIAATSVVTVEIGTNATASGTGANQIENPAAGTYTIDIGGTMADSGTFAVPIVDADQVSLSATINPTITFDIDDSVADADTDTPYTVEIGTITTTDTRVSGATDTVKGVWIDLDTNASGGAIVTVKNENGANGLVSASVSDDNINSADGTMADGTENYGLCVASASLSGLTAVAPFASTCAVDSETNAVGGLLTTAQTILNTGGAAVSAGRAEIVVNAAISVTSAAHSDYADTLTLIATGTF
jgi:hypothetical protein